MGSPTTRILAVLALLVAVGVGTALSPFASSSPDGLERVAEDEAFADRAGEHVVREGVAPIPDYAFPGIADERLATGIAGFAGTLAAFAVGWALAFALRRRSPPPPAGA